MVVGPYIPFGAISFLLILIDLPISARVLIWWISRTSRTDSAQVTCGVFLQGVLFLSPLTLALAYTYAQENPTRRLSYFIITFQAKYLPYAMLAMTFVMASPQAALTQATGLVAAHLYDFLTKVWPEYGGGRQLIKTPTIVRQWFQQPVGTGQTRAFGTAFQSRPAQSAPQRPAGGSRGWASGFSSGSWSGRGTGRRLGGE